MYETNVSLPRALLVAWAEMLEGIANVPHSVGVVAREIREATDFWSNDDGGDPADDSAEDVWEARREMYGG